MLTDVESYEVEAEMAAAAMYLDGVLAAYL